MQHAQTESPSPSQDAGKDVNWKPLGYNLEMCPKFEPKNACIHMGIDEAGRGPTLGPMVYAAAFCTADDVGRLSEVGYKDSKVLSPAKREKMFENIRNGKPLKIGYMICVIKAEEISGLMTDIIPTNLNQISHNAAIKLIAAAQSNGVNINKVYIDTVGDPKKYESKLNKLFPNIDVIVSKKADSLYPIVSAASICAKFTRDKIMENWIFSEGENTKLTRDWGSGYPSDPKTKNWMKVNIEPIFGYPNIVRFSWSPCIDALKRWGVPVKWHDNEPEAKCPVPKSGRFGNNLRMDYGDVEATKIIQSSPRFRFFSDNNMEIVNDFEK